MKKIILLSLCFVYTLSNAQSIKKEKVKTSFLTYPMISISDFSIDNIKLEFCSDQVKVGDKTQIEGANLCKPKGGKISDAKAIKTYYYNVKYISPDALVKISDKDGKILFMDYLQKAGASSDNFGDKDCYFLPMVLESAWKKKEALYLNELNTKVNNELFNNSKNFFKKALFFSYTTKEFKISYIKDYSDLTKAKDIALKGYSLIKNNAKNEAGQSKLNDAVAIWNKALQESNLDDRKARINKKITIELYENIATAQMFLMKFDDAGKNIKKAIDLRPNITTNATEQRKALSYLIRSLQKNYNLNKDVPVSLETKDLTINKINNAGYSGFLAEYKKYASETFKDEMTKAKNEYNERVASGEINPYREQMTKTATQGYMLTLPNLSAPMSSLAEMKEAMKKLEEFPIKICELTELNQLLLGNNHIKSIPVEIKNLQNLKRLNLSKNQLTSLPDELGELKKLETLIIKGNSIAQSDIDKIRKMLPNCKIKY